MIRHLLIDLDDTLYPANNGVWPAISERINAYMTTRLELAADEVASARARYARAFGTTLAGLMADYQIDPDEYLEYVHDIPLDQFVRPDPALRTALSRLPQEKSVFTNASRGHAVRTLQLLGVQDLFERIISIESLELVNKPELGAYTRVLELLERPDPTACAFADDRVRNLEPAARLGMTTVLVDGAGQTGDGVHYAISHVHELAEAIPALLEEDDHGLV